MTRGQYRSPLRDAGAEETRRKIRVAARRLFEQVGFTHTTIKQIAESAGVSVPTVYATYESKGGLVVALLEDLEADVDMGSRGAEMLAEPDARRSLRIFVAANRALFETGHAVLRAAIEAIGLPAVAALASEGDANRRRGADLLAQRAEHQGVLADDIEPVQAAETIWMLTGPQLYLLATETLGWSADDYEQSTLTTIERAILTPNTQR